ncbi:unnamed protein product [Hanseniaspora opuntiae]
MSTTEPTEESELLRDTWNFVEPSIKELLDNVNMNTPMSHVDQNCNPALYMKVYTCIYNFCVQLSRNSSNREIETMNIVNKDGKQDKLIYDTSDTSNLYMKLARYIIDFLDGLIPEDLIDNNDKKADFLNFYKKTFPKYVKVISTLDKIFDYMNRFWIESQRSNGNPNVFKVYQLGLNCWRHIIYTPNQDLIVKMTIDSCNEYRQLQLEHVIKLEEDESASGVDKNAIRKQSKDLVQRIYWPINSSLMICIGPSEYMKSTDELYNRFRTVFEVETQKFYKDYSKNLLSTKSLDYFVKFVLKIREFEETTINELTKAYNYGSLSASLDEVLVIDNFERFLTSFGDSYHTLIQKVDIKEQASFVVMNNSNEYNTLVSIWDSIKLHPQLVHKLSEYFGVYCTKYCCERIMKSVGYIDFKDYITLLIQLYDFNKLLLEDIMNLQAAFVKVFDNSCKNFFNHNTFAQPDPKEMSHQPEILAKHADTILKKPSKNQTYTYDFYKEKDNIVILFQYLDDKDTFEHEYRKLFTKRLIHGTTRGESYEVSLITSFQGTNSLEYTGKISKMLQDITSSRELLETKDVKFEPSVVAKAMWPFTEDQQLENETMDSVLCLPDEMKSIFQSFEHVYQEQHQGRVLHWLWSLSKTELEANISKPGRPPFRFILSIYQTMILMNLQNTNTLKLSDLAQNFQMKFVIAHLIPFFSKKLVTLIKEDGSTIKSIAELKNYNEVTVKLNVPYKALNQSINFTIGINVGLAESVLNGEYHD